MNPKTIAAIVLIVAGALGLVYEQFSFTKETHQAKIGPIELSVKEKETVSIPKWLGGGAIALGVLLLVVGRKK
jgi:drug/metabolite transporter (DMT)-like permease